MRKVFILKITQIIDLLTIYDNETPSPICSAYFKNKKIEISSLNNSDEKFSFIISLK